VTRPCFLVTRPAGQAAALVSALADHGIEGVAVPTVAIRPADPVTLAAALRDTAWDWVVVTSANGVEPVAAAVRDAPLPGATRLAAVGAPTADALRAAGLRVDHVPEAFRTVAIADGLGALDGRRVLLARADAATPDLRDALLARGATVREVIAYRTVEGPPDSREPLRAAIAAGIDGITFTSGSTVRGLVALLDDPAALATARATVAACIGPVTAAEAARHGFEPWVVAQPHTASALAASIAAHLRLEIPA
jgi:uroporphyrinogen-III synthase